MSDIRAYLECRLDQLYETLHEPVQACALHQARETERLIRIDEIRSVLKYNP